MWKILILNLRDEQKPIEDHLKNAYERGGGIISIRCGGGKTVLALHISSVLKKPKQLLLSIRIF